MGKPEATESRIPPAVYPLTAAGGDHRSLAAQLLEAGALWLQVRDKNRTPDKALLEQLDHIHLLAGRQQARILINDRVDLVQAVGAAGVHLGQNDLPVGRARALLGPQALIGISTHSREQFERACQQDVDYIAVGPIFATSSKVSSNPPLGPEFLRRIRPLTRRPIVAIGGINLERAGSVWELGIDSVAVLSDIVQHECPGDRLREYLQLSKERS